MKIPKLDILTHPDLPALLLKTGAVAKAKNYWFSGGKVKLKPKNAIEINSYSDKMRSSSHLKASLGGPARTTGLSRV